MNFVEGVFGWNHGRDVFFFLRYGEWVGACKWRSFRGESCDRNLAVLRQQRGKPIRAERGES